MAKITYSEAIRRTLRELMLKDERVLLFGEDIGAYDGVFKCTRGFLKEFGPERIVDTPISELSFVGAGVGMALSGLRPIVELMFVDFALLAMDQIVNQAAKLKYMSGGAVEVPLIVRTNLGTRGGAAAQHSQSLHASFLHYPGLVVVAPSNPADARGLLLAAYESRKPVLFLENKQLYFLSGDVPDNGGPIPLSRCAIARRGKDLTIVACSYSVVQALEAAEILAGDGIEAEVVDPRTLVPLDYPTIAESIRKTSRVLIVDEGYLSGGFTQILAGRIAAESFFDLDAPVAMLAHPDVPIPYSPALEKPLLNTPETIAAKARELCAV
jgi:pyruvate dehydrogenase E1 component beta subunit